MTTYIVDYGTNLNHWLMPPKHYTSLRAATHEAAQAVRELGPDAWAHVVRTTDNAVLARWLHGKRVTP